MGYTNVENLIEGNGVDFFVNKLYQHTFTFITLEFKGFTFISLGFKDFPHIASRVTQLCDVGHSETIQPNAQTLRELERDGMRPSRLKKLLITIIDKNDLMFNMVNNTLEHNGQERFTTSSMKYTDPTVGLYGEGQIHSYRGEPQRKATTRTTTREAKVIVYFGQYPTIRKLEFFKDSKRTKVLGQLRKVCFLETGVKERLFNFDQSIATQDSEFSVNLYNTVQGQPQSIGCLVAKVTAYLGQSPRSDLDDNVPGGLLPEIEVFKLFC